MIICICSHCPVLILPPQLHLRSGIRFSQAVWNLEPLHVAFTVGFMLLWDSKATTDLTGASTQAIIWVMGSSCKYRWSFTGSPATHFLLCGLIPITGHGSVPVSGLVVRDGCSTPSVIIQVNTMTLHAIVYLAHIVKEIGAHGNQFIIYIEGLFPGVTLGAHQSMFKEEMDGILKKMKLEST